VLNFVICGRGILRDIVNGLIGAVKLLLTFNVDIYEIIGLSLFVSILSSVIASLIAIPCGIFIGLRNFKGRNALIKIINTLMGLPPVLGGLFVYLLLSRKGPLGFTELLFTPIAMIIAQTLLVTPIICGIVMSATQTRGKAIYEALFTLNAKRKDMLIYLVREMKLQIIGAFTVGFGRAISEVGAVMLVGGNIEHKTRVMTTYIVLQTGMGNFDKAIAIGLVLLIVAFLINTLVSKLSKENENAS
jgi:tungstate transport system permease protein